MEARNILPALGVGPKPREEVGRDAPAVLGRGANVVDRRDLLDENTLRVDEGDAARQRLFGSHRSHHGRAYAAQRDPDGTVRSP